MRALVLRQMCPWTAVVLVAAAAAACSKNETAQARGREAAAKAVKVEVVKRERVARSVDLVGTLAAVDQVTISSEADGKVSYGREQASFPIAARSQSSAANATTLAVTTPLSHAVYLFALAGAA